VATVLVIDDNPSVRSYISTLLQAEGHGVVEATEGVEGIRLYREDRPDLVICDIFMPEKEGIETIRELRALDPRVRIVAMTGGGTHTRTTTFLDMAERFGAVGALAKPFGRDELLRAVEQALCSPG
jgi:CheY-like chemotaxis protein